MIKVKEEPSCENQSSKVKSSCLGFARTEKYRFATVSQPGMILGNIVKTSRRFKASFERISEIVVPQ
jgi:hypothetical protein